MYELAIEHHHSGLSLSVHPDRGDAADALGAYSSTVDGFPRVLQLTGPHSSYEFIDPADGHAIAIATIEHRAADPIAEKHFAAAKAALHDTLATAGDDERRQLRIAWDRITGAVNHTKPPSPQSRLETRQP
jgi:hypothetical protein